MSLMNASRIPPPLGQLQKGCMVFGYVSVTDKMQFFNTKIRELEADGKIPNLDAEVIYTIYRWKPAFLSHESIVVGFCGKFFTIEVRVIDKRLILYTTAVDADVNKFKYCAKKMATGYELISNAVNVFKSMAGYNFATNNCQDFVNLFLKSIDLIDQVQETDTHWLAKMGAMAAVGLGAAALVGFSLKSPPQKNKK